MRNTAQLDYLLTREIEADESINYHFDPYLINLIDLKVNSNQKSKFCTQNETKINPKNLFQISVRRLSDILITDFETISTELNKDDFKLSVYHIEAYIETVSKMNLEIRKYLLEINNHPKIDKYQLFLTKLSDKSKLGEN